MSDVHRRARLSRAEQRRLKRARQHDGDTNACKKAKTAKKAIIAVHAESHAEMTMVAAGPALPPPKTATQLDNAMPGPANMAHLLPRLKRLKLHRIREGGLCICSNFWPPAFVERVKADAVALHRHGAFAAADPGDEAGTATGIGRHKRGPLRRTRMCEKCDLFADAVEATGVGDEEARAQIFSCMEALRAKLETVLQHPLSRMMELQYLRYPGSGCGYYKRHTDHQGQHTRNRLISLLMYLHPAGTEGTKEAICASEDERAWDTARDGGALLVYTKPPPSPPLSIEPHGGKLVLFQSAGVEHEVTPTKRERWALVGWFLNGREVKVQMSKKKKVKKRKTHPMRKAKYK